MRLDADACWVRLRGTTHGVLATAHEGRGVDAVPVVFALVADDVVVPIDTVKPKSSTRLQRVANIERDPRCVLLIEHYDDDWSQLWWVRAHGRASASTPSDAHLAALAARHPQYEAPGTIPSVLVIAIDAISGWSAT